MTIYIENESDIKLNIPYRIIIEDSINLSLDFEKVPYECEISVTIVDDERIHEINKEFTTYVYIGKNTITCCELKKEENWRVIRTSNDVEEKSKLEDKIKALEDKVKSLIGVKVVTQAELDALEERDEHTLYYIKDL